MIEKVKRAEKIFQLKHDNYPLALTLKWLGHFFQNVISFSDAIHLMCNIFIWNWSNTKTV